jgi:hexosaminidase
VERICYPENIDSRIWPRTAAIAERFWSPASVTDENSMYSRLEKISLQLEWAGLKNESYYPVMLRRLTRSENIEPLKTLTDVCEALEEYNRDPNFRESTGLSFKENLPFARVMDAVKPESDVARKFNKQVTDYLANPSQEKRMNF